MFIGILFVGIGMFLALVLPSYDTISMSNSNLTIRDFQMKNMDVGMVIGGFLIIRNYWKTSSISTPQRK